MLHMSLYLYLGINQSSVIAVTGLTGSVYGSWISCQSSRKCLNDLLPNTVPSLRVITYCYDTRMLGKRNSKVRLPNYSSKCIEYLENAIFNVSIYSF